MQRLSSYLLSYTAGVAPGLGGSSKRLRHLGQAALDTILQHPDCPFDLPIGLTVANGDVVMNDTKTFAQPCKAARKLSAIVSLDVVWFTPTGNQVVVEELGGPLTV